MNKNSYLNKTLHCMSLNNSNCLVATFCTNNFSTKMQPNKCEYKESTYITIKIRRNEKFGTKFYSFQKIFKGSTTNLMEL